MVTPELIPSAKALHAVVLKLASSNICIQTLEAYFVLRPYNLHLMITSALRAKHITYPCTYGIILRVSREIGG